MKNLCTDINNIEVGDYFYFKGHQKFVSFSDNDEITGKFCIVTKISDKYVTGKTLSTNSYNISINRKNLRIRGGNFCNYIYFIKKEFIKKENYTEFVKYANEKIMSYRIEQSLKKINEELSKYSEMDKKIIIGKLNEKFTFNN